MNHFYFSLLSIRQSSETIKPVSYDNLKDQERLLLKEKEVSPSSVAWKSHRRQLSAQKQEKALKVRRTF